jgi:hypothetical protein
MDGEGNATVENNLSVGGDTLLKKTLDVGATGRFRSDVRIDGELDVANLVISGSELIDGSLTVKGDVRATSFTTGVTGITGGNITCAAPGKFVGDGSGLTNLPITVLSRTPTFAVQSTLTDFSIGANRFDPEADPSVVLTLGMEFVGKDSGLYYWQTTTNAESIIVQEGFNSASGWLIWDGSKVNGVSTYSLTQQAVALNPIYQLTWSEIGFVSQTYMRVITEDTNVTAPVNPIFAGNYFVEFYRVLPLSS